MCAIKANFNDSFVSIVTTKDNLELEINHQLQEMTLMLII